MQSFLSDPNVSYVSPQLHSSGLCARSGGIPKPHRISTALRSWSAGAGNDPHVLMQSFLADPNVNYISPQMYGPGLDYPSSNIAGYDWQAGWKTTPAKIVLSLTSAGDYNNYVPLFQGLGIPLAGLVVFTE